jgi:RNA polymerase sigma-70 factor (ECF subfamily)
MTALSDDVQSLLDAERDIDAPGPAARKRLLDRLESLLVPVALVAAGAAATTSTASAAATADAAGGGLMAGALKAKIGVALLSAALVGGAVGAAGHAYLAEPPPPPHAVAPVAPRAVVPQPPAPEPVKSTLPEPALLAPPPSAPRQERARPAGSLRAERLLIETAAAALVRGDNASAVAALREHAQKFPRGDLAEEREVLLAKARAASGDGTSIEKRSKNAK